MIIYIAAAAALLLAFALNRMKSLAITYLETKNRDDAEDKVQGVKFMNYLLNFLVAALLFMPFLCYGFDKPRSEIQPVVDFLLALVAIAFAVVGFFIARLIRSYKRELSKSKPQQP